MYVFQKRFFENAVKYMWTFQLYIYEPLDWPTTKRKFSAKRDSSLQRLAYKAKAFLVALVSSVR